MRIAFAGNPNSGKTSMYNVLTGRRERVGNWAGVTVDKKESLVRKKFNDADEEIIAVDLPGAYSMSPFTSEESITRDYVIRERPDVIVNIVDAANLSRSLFFTTQLLELGIPVVVALNKSDLVKKKKSKIDVKVLSDLLGCDVFETVSISAKDNGLKAVVNAAVKAKEKVQKAPFIREDIDSLDKESVESEDRKRFEFVKGIVDKAETKISQADIVNRQDKFDRLLLNKWIGIPFFAVVMWMVFYVSQSTVGVWIADGFELKSGVIVPGLVSYIEMFGAWVEGVLGESINPFFRAVLVDGIIGGVGAVIGFLPLVMVMYFLLAILEDCGYMARASVVLDPIFKRVGLSGKSVIPMIIGTGCAIPGIMACRTIRDEREKKTTAILTSFIPCGAKIPVIALFAGVFFPGHRWISPIMYFSGILLILFWAVIVNLITGQKRRKSFFIIELPDYKFPSFKKACFSMLERGKAYIIKAGTIILVCNTVVMIMASFNIRLEFVENPASSQTILELLATPIAVILIPLGFGTWKLAAAAITGFIAKEEVVGTLATVFAISETVINNDLELVGDASAVAGSFGLTAVSALAYLAFNLFTPPCFAAIGAMNSEVKDKRWVLGGILLQLGTGYTVSYLVYQIGSFVTTGKSGEGFFAGLIAVIVMIGIVVGMVARKRKVG